MPFRKGAGGDMSGSPAASAIATDDQTSKAEVKDSTATDSQNGTEVQNDTTATTNQSGATKKATYKKRKTVHRTTKSNL